MRFAFVAWVQVCVMASWAIGQEVRVRLEPSMVRSSSPLADFSGLVDEQDKIGNPPKAAATNGWNIPSQHNKSFPFSASFDLGSEQNLSAIWFYDTYNIGPLTISAGQPGQWQAVTNYDCGSYMQWVRVPLEVTTRHLQIELKSPAAIFTEIALYAYTPEAHQSNIVRKAAEARARAERDEAIARAQAEVAKRPWLDLPPFGRVQLVDEVDCGGAEPGHQFRESPAGVSRVESILGRPCRILGATTNESAYMAFRLGKWKLLKPGAAYVLAVEYPEDQPRSVIVMNGGNETSRGFHTGTTLGDALHPKYVRSNPESLKIPLSDRYEHWALYFNMHDRFPDLQFLRGPGPRKLSVEDGFDVVIAQFPARNDPTSAGAAVSRIRLFEVAEEAKLAQSLSLPPSPLPRRHIFWREEMADGVIDSDKETERGVKERFDWYRYKANQMRFMGINTFSKDLLEFGACQHWDPTPYGGNDWVHFADSKKHLWGQIVEWMGRQGFEVLPYYEYAGSRGYKSLGHQRRCKPLTRDDAYTHISWVENANADITDPDTAADFNKMLDATVVRFARQARFAGAWLRPRWQLPMSFGDGARERFAREANQGKAVTRANLIADKALLDRYETWWFGKRRQFLAGARDYLRTNGIPEAAILFTAEAGEPGTSFATWEKRLVTDDVGSWQSILSRPEHILNQQRITPVSLEQVAANRWYLEALQAAPLNWGNWEFHHANPPADPVHYQDTPGVLMTHCFNTRYTVDLPESLRAFSGPAGLALVRHYSLNENMMFDSNDKEKLGYFVADFERAGSACMMAEALAVANGNPTYLGYLHGNNFGRGFPSYTRDFNANFLALPALPSDRMSGASTDPAVVVRAIRTPAHGTYLAVVNTASAPRANAAIRVPGNGRVLRCVSGAAVAVKDSAVTLELRPFQLVSLHVGRE